MASSLFSLIAIFFVLSPFSALDAFSMGYEFPGLQQEKEACNDCTYQMTKPQSYVHSSTFYGSLMEFSMSNHAREAAEEACEKAEEQFYINGGYDELLNLQCVNNFCLEGQRTVHCKVANVTLDFCSGQANNNDKNDLDLWVFLGNSDHAFIAQVEEANGYLIKDRIGIGVKKYGCVYETKVNVWGELECFPTFSLPTIFSANANQCEIESQQIFKQY